MEVVRRLLTQERAEENSSEDAEFEKLREKND